MERNEELQMRYATTYDPNCEFDSYEQALKQSIATTESEILENIVKSDGYDEYRLECTPQDLLKASAKLALALDGKFVLRIRRTIVTETVTEIGPAEKDENK